MPVFWGFHKNGQFWQIQPTNPICFNYEIAQFSKKVIANVWMMTHNGGERWKEPERADCA